MMTAADEIYKAWQSGERRCLHQYEHEIVNGSHYPGTRQLCAWCDNPTGRCEEDTIWTSDGEGPLCEDCWHGTDEWLSEHGDPEQQEAALKRMGVANQ